MRRPGAARAAYTRERQTGQAMTDTIQDPVIRTPGKVRTPQLPRTTAMTVRVLAMNQGYAIRVLEDGAGFQVFGRRPDTAVEFRDDGWILSIYKGHIIEVITAEQAHWYLDLPPKDETHFPPPTVPDLEAYEKFLQTLDYKST